MLRITRQELVKLNREFLYFFFFFFGTIVIIIIVCRRGEIIRITYLIIDIIRLAKVFWHSVVVRLRQEPFYGGTLFGLQQ